MIDPVLLDEAKAHPAKVITVGGWHYPLVDHKHIIRRAEQGMIRNGAVVSGINLPPEGEATMKLNVTVSKTSRGDQDYLQVMSEDAVSINIVLVADEIKVRDARLKEKP